MKELLDYRCKTNIVIDKNHLIKSNSFYLQSLRELIDNNIKFQKVRSLLLLSKEYLQNLLLNKIHRTVITSIFLYHKANSLVTDEFPLQKWFNIKSICQK